MTPAVETYKIGGQRVRLKPDGTLDVVSIRERVDEPAPVRPVQPVATKAPENPTSVQCSCGAVLRLAASWTAVTCGHCGRTERW